MKKFYSIILTVSLLLLCSCSYNAAQTESEDVGGASVQTSELSSEESSDIGADVSESTSDSSTTGSSDAEKSASAEIQVEYSQSDIELQNILLENYELAYAYYQFFTDGRWAYGDIDVRAEEKDDGLHELNIKALLSQFDPLFEKPTTSYYYLLSDEMLSDLECSLNSCYSKEMTDVLLKQYGVCRAEEVIKGDGGIYQISTDSSEYLTPSVIEINGRLYHSESTQSIGERINWSTAKVISRTEDEIVFGYLAYEPYQCDEVHGHFGRLRYEDGWKFDWDFYEHDDEVWLEEIWGMTSNCRAPFLPCYTDENADPFYIEEAPPIEITAEYSEAAPRKP